MSGRKRILANLLHRSDNRSRVVDMNTIQHEIGCLATVNHGDSDYCTCEAETVRYCASCGEPEGSYYAKRCCTDDNMLED